MEHERVGVHRLDAVIGDGRATQERHRREPCVRRLDRKRQRRLARDAEVGRRADTPSPTRCVERPCGQRPRRQHERLVGPCRGQVVPRPRAEPHQFVCRRAPQGDFRGGREFCGLGAVVAKEHLHPAPVRRSALLPVAHLGGHGGAVGHHAEAGDVKRRRTRDRRPDGGGSDQGRRDDATVAEGPHVLNSPAWQVTGNQPHAAALAPRRAETSAAMRIGRPTTFSQIMPEPRAPARGFLPGRRSVRDDPRVLEPASRERMAGCS